MLIKNGDALYQVKEIEVTPDKNAVNELLADGWILLGVATGQEQTDSHDYTPMFMFCVGKVTLLT